MKKLVFFLAIFFSAALFVKEASAVKLIFQTRAHGKDCDKDRGLCIMIEVEIKEIVDIIKPAAWHTNANCDGSVLTLETLKLGTPWGGSDFVVDADIQLPSEIARALGYRSILIKAGTYKIDFSTNSQGSVKVPVRTT